MDTESDPELLPPVRRHDDVPAPHRRVHPEQPVKVPEKEPGVTERTAYRGGPGWDYPCDNPYIIECTSPHCQAVKRCRLIEYFMLFNDEQPAVKP